MKNQKEHLFTVRKKFSKSLIERLKNSKENKIREGEVYCLHYTSKELSTDKWHTIPLLFITEINSENIVGFNLLYLKDNVVKNILTFAQRENKKYSSSKIKSLIEADLDRSPWNFSKKTFENRYIAKILHVPREDWKKIVKLDKVPFGNLNEKLLVEDWYLEKFQNSKNKNIAEKKTSKDDIAEVSSKKRTFEVYEDLNFREIIFEKEREKGSLMDLRDEILDDDI